VTAGDGALRLRALVIQHEQPTPGGYVHQWLEERGAEQDIYRIDVEEREVSARDYDMIVSLGSEFAAFDDSIPWLEREKRLLLEAAEEDIAVLGICFGGQLLARVRGGESFKGQQSEIGWLPIRSTDRSLIGDGPWFQWHFDTFTPPADAELIAESWTPGLCRGPQSRLAVPPRGDPANHGRVGSGVPARARSGGSRCRRPARADEPPR
jgi:GMP synthase-like glutamine amidotransferase